MLPHGFPGESLFQFGKAYRNGASMNAINERIKLRRMELGVTDVALAKEVGLSIEEYSDVERHADELFSTVELHTAKKICESLKLDFFFLLKMRCAFCEEGRPYSDEYSRRRDELIRIRRNQLGLTVEALGDCIGFETVAVNNMESDPNYLETWPVRFIDDLADALDVPLQILVSVKCESCMR